MHCKHSLDVVFGVTEDDSVSLLATWLSSNGLDLHTLHDRVLHPPWSVFEDVGKAAGIDALERLTSTFTHDERRTECGSGYCEEDVDKRKGAGRGTNTPLERGSWPVASAASTRSSFTRKVDLLGVTWLLLYCPARVGVISPNGALPTR